MTISVSLSPSTIVAATGDEPNLILMRAAVANNDIVACLYEDDDVLDGDPPEVRYILYNRQTDTPGSSVLLNDNPQPVDPISGAGLSYLLSIEDNRLLSFFRNDLNSSGYGAVITNSGLTPAVQPDTMYFEADGSNFDRGDDTVAAKHITLATGLIAYRTNEGGNPKYYQSFTVASGNVSFGTAVTASNNAIPFDLIHWTGNKYLLAEFWTSLTLRVLDTTSGINEGDQQYESTTTFVNFAQLSRIDSSRALAVFFDDDDNAWYACVLTLFGSDQVIFGTPLTLQTGVGNDRVCTNILNRGDGNFTVGYQVSDTDWKFESVNVSGTTVTKLNDNTTVTLGGVTDAHLLGFEGTEAGLVYADQGAEEVRYRVVSNVPELVVPNNAAIFYYGLNDLANSRSIIANV